MLLFIYSEKMLDQVRHCQLSSISDSILSLATYHRPYRGFLSSDRNRYLREHSKTLNVISKNHTILCITPGIPKLSQSHCVDGKLENFGSFCFWDSGY